MRLDRWQSSILASSGFTLAPGFKGPEDEDYVKKRTAELAAKAELSSEKTVKDVGREMTRS